MRVFLDTSACAKRWVNEAGAVEVGQICADADRLGVSVICRPELMSAFSRLVREAKISPDIYHELKARVVEDFSEMDVVGVNDAIVNQAVLLLEGNVLRAMDALHIATAMFWQAGIFVSADVRQITAARNGGLRVQLVGN